MRKYKRIPLLSEADFRIAEAWQARGWRVILSGIDYILLEK
jgi:hypothetical protein